MNILIVVFCELETAERARIYTVNREGEKLPKETIERGIEVEHIDEPIFEHGKYPIHYINPQTKEMWYEYEPRELTEQERIQELETLTGDLMMELALLKMGGTF